MKIIDTTIPDVKIIKPTVFSDERGFFFESFNQQHFEEAIGREVKFVQDNHSYSKIGVLRGLHFQSYPYAQGKLIRCISGEIFDVAVDIRKNSPYFGKWFGTHLSEKNKNQIWIPEGFAHGFYTLSITAEVLYKVNNYWQKDAEATIHWNDPTLNIKWPIDKGPILSTKDKNGSPLN